jgi:hypothetical protein
MSFLFLNNFFPRHHILTFNTLPLILYFNKTPTLSVIMWFSTSYIHVWLLICFRMYFSFFLPSDVSRNELGDIFSIVFKLANYRHLFFPLIPEVFIILPGALHSSKFLLRLKSTFFIKYVTWVLVLHFYNTIRNYFLTWKNICKSYIKSFKSIYQIDDTNMNCYFSFDKYVYCLRIQVKKEIFHIVSGYFIFIQFIITENRISLH